MTMKPDGTATCDKCGGPAGNGSLPEAVVVHDLDERGMAVTLHACRAGGCAAKAVSRRAFPHRP